MVVVVLLLVWAAGVLGFADYRWRATTARVVIRMRHDGVGSQRPSPLLCRRAYRLAGSDDALLSVCTT